MNYDVDVAIVGTGAGGGVSAEILSHAGLRVLMVEEGPHWTTADFHMFESESYPNLYQESAGRKTKDKGINILQGRSVGGSTTVNWTTSLRTPSDTLTYWREHFGLSEFTDAMLLPWFETMEARLNIKPWIVPPNGNNDVLQRGAKAIGVPVKSIPRNVKGCWNLGYCGLGCPTGAKQSMLLTTIPSAIRKGAILLARTRAERFVQGPQGITHLECAQMDERGIAPTSNKMTVRAKHFVAAGGAINTPALLLRSGLPDPFSRLGKRTFLHPTVLSAAIMPENVDGFSGAPQSIYCDHYLHEGPVDGKIGYKLEVPPLHPLLMSTTLPGFGAQHAQLMAQMRHANAIIALMRDGFHEQSVGGAVELKADGTPLLDYQITDYVWEGMRRALDVMAQIQFAAGAKTVYPLHENAVQYASLGQARDAISKFPMEILRTRVASAHVMGGCAMGADPKVSVIAGDGTHHQVDNLSVFDGSMFPTSLGANPQLTIYGIVARNATMLAKRLT